jgi:hypothetical protein
MLVSKPVQVTDNNGAIFSLHNRLRTFWVSNVLYTTEGFIHNDAYNKTSFLVQIKFITED